MIRSKKAVQGDAPAQNNLGVIVLQGEGVEQDYKVAFNWFKKAAEQGHPVVKTALTKALESK
ncbi:hypothetical protein AGMMS49921_02000 [Endomicrobiia bacterium]|nr:hypothetical protein AGMMS49921_02000 [Endomicrobiia bacterium]